MSSNDCPACGSRITFWQRQQQRSGRLDENSQCFLCPNCGVTLTWSYGRWRWISTAGTIVGIVALTYLLSIGAFQQQAYTWIMVICLSMIVWEFVLWLAVGQLVVADDANGNADNIHRGPSEV